MFEIINMERIVKSLPIILFVCACVLVSITTAGTIANAAATTPITRVVMLVDVSGSTETERRIKTLKQWCGALRLDPDLRRNPQLLETEFVVVTFSDQAQTSWRGPVGAIGEQELIDLVSASATSQAHGTDLGNALKAVKAYAEPSTALALFSDFHADDIKNVSGTSIEVARPFNMGFGEGSVNKAFPWDAFKGFGKIIVIGVDGLDLVSRLEAIPELSGAYIRAEKADTRPVPRMSELVKATHADGSASKLQFKDTPKSLFIAIAAALIVAGYFTVQGRGSKKATRNS